VIYIFAEQMF